MMEHRSQMERRLLGRVRQHLCSVRRTVLLWPSCAVSSSGWRKHWGQRQEARTPHSKHMGACSMAYLSACV